MEDCNMLAADCLVICCCSQCLILQIIIFVLLKLPFKLFRKTKDYAKKKFGVGRGRKEEKIMIERVKGGFQDEAVELHTINSMSMSIELIQAGFPDGGEGQYGFRCCIQEAEKVLEELSHKGEFAFGSFWGRSGSETSGIISSSSSSSSSMKDLILCSTIELVDIASFS